MPDTIADRRDAVRYPLIVAAEIIVIASGTRVLGRTSDVSRTGCYVDTLNPPPRGSRIQLRLARGAESFESEAVVMYVSPGLGMGVRFHEYIPESQLPVLDRWLSDAAKNR